LGPGPLGPEARSQLVEDGERLRERLAGGFALLCMTSHDTEGEQDTAALERERTRLEVGQRLLEGDEGGVEVALGGGEQATTTADGRLGPRASEPSRARLELLQVDARPLEIADRDQRLDRVLPDRVHRIVEAPCEQSIRQIAETEDRRLRITEGEIDAAE